MRGARGGWPLAGRPFAAPLAPAAALELTRSPLSPCSAKCNGKADVCEECMSGHFLKDGKCIP